MRRPAPVLARYAFSNIQWGKGPEEGQKQVTGTIDWTCFFRPDVINYFHGRVGSHVLAGFRPLVSAGRGVVRRTNSVTKTRQWVVHIPLPHGPSGDKVPSFCAAFPQNGLPNTEGGFLSCGKSECL